jgi:hypothetical protein
MFMNDKLEIKFKLERDPSKKMEILDELREFFDKKAEHKKSIYYLKKQLKLTLNEETKTSIYRQASFFNKKSFFLGLLLKNIVI